MRYLMTFSYDGSKYNGYQKQPNKRTIQSEIEKALTTINNNCFVSISASGRTDALVHAINQKAHFDLNINITCDKLKKAINSLIPKDIYVKKIETVSDSFHARYNVLVKQYIYKINIGEYNPIEKDYVLQLCHDLNITEIKKALKYLEGTHNFKSFVKANPDITDYTRTIIETDIKEENNILIISFLGTGFLRYMVRNMVGLLIEIGLGKRKSEDVITILNKEDRTSSGITALPNGLYLKDVFYE